MSSLIPKLSHIVREFLNFSVAFWVPGPKDDTLFDIPHSVLWYMHQLCPIIGRSFASHTILSPDSSDQGWLVVHLKSGACLVEVKRKPLRPRGECFSQQEGHRPSSPFVLMPRKYIYLLDMMESLIGGPLVERRKRFRAVLRAGPSPPDR
jgi:hypothetical protein